MAKYTNIGMRSLLLDVPRLGRYVFLRSRLQRSIAVLPSIFLIDFLMISSALAILRLVLLSLLAPILISIVILIPLLIFSRVLPIIVSLVVVVPMTIVIGPIVFVVAAVIVVLALWFLLWGLRGFGLFLKGTGENWNLGLFLGSFLYGWLLFRCLLGLDLLLGFHFGLWDCLGLGYRLFLFRDWLGDSFWFLDFGLFNHLLFFLLLLLLLFFLLLFLLFFFRFLLLDNLLFLFFVLNLYLLFRLWCVALQSCIIVLVFQVRA